MLVNPAIVLSFSMIAKESSGRLMAILHDDY